MDDELERLLDGCRQGNQAALDELFVKLMPNLKVMARSCLRGQHVGVTKQATAFLNDFFIRLRNRLNGRLFSEEKAAPIMARLAQEMRNQIMDQVRKARVQKRGGRIPHVSLEDGEVLEVACARAEALNEALEALKATHERAYLVFVSREQWGCTVAETAELLRISESTVIRDYVFARAYLRGELQKLKGSGGKCFVAEKQ